MLIGHYSVANTLCDQHLLHIDMLKHKVVYRTFNVKSDL